MACMVCWSLFCPRPSQVPNTANVTASVSLSKWLLNQWPYLSPWLLWAFVLPQYWICCCVSLNKWLPRKMLIHSSVNGNVKPSSLVCWSRSCVYIQKLWTTDHSRLVIILILVWAWSNVWNQRHYIHSLSLKFITFSGKKFLLKLTLHQNKISHLSMRAMSLSLTTKYDQLGLLNILLKILSAAYANNIWNTLFQHYIEFRKVILLSLKFWYTKINA